MKFKIARVFHSFLLVAAAGCGGGSGSPDAAPPPDPPDARPIDAALPPDAHPPDLTCAGMDPPVLVVPDPLTIAGFTRSIGASGASPVAGVAVEARQVSDDSVVASDISRNDGAYSLSVVTGAVALTGYLHATADTFFPTNLFPPDPIQKDIGMLTIPLFAKQLLPLLATLAGTELKPGDGVAIVQVHDCAGDGMAGVVVMAMGWRWADLAQQVSVPSGGSSRRQKHPERCRAGPHQACTCRFPARLLSHRSPPTRAGALSIAR